MKYEAVLFFDGPLSQFKRSCQSEKSKNRLPYDAREVIGRKGFRFRSFAEGWAVSRLREFQNCLFFIRDVNDPTHSE